MLSKYEFAKPVEGLITHYGNNSSNVTLNKQYTLDFREFRPNRAV